MLNLFLNGLEALDAVPPSRRALSVETSIGDSGAVQIAVRDSGVGLDSAQLDRIFDPFYTTKENGLGMGLSINRSIVVEHNGRLWATQNEDHGLTLTFVLPAAPKAD